MSYYDPRPVIMKFEEVDYIVPERLRSARLYKGISLEEMAEKVGISTRQLGRYENGKDEIPKELLFWYMQETGFRGKYYYRLEWQRV